MRGYYPHGRSFREHQHEHAEVDALRWGDRDVIAGVAIVGVPVYQSSKQLIRTHQPRPAMWNVMFNVEETTFPSGEGALVLLLFQGALGTGSSVTQVRQQIELVPPFYRIPPETPIPPYTFQGSHMQVGCILSYTPTVAGPYAVPVAAMSAPWAHQPFGESRPRFRVDR